MKKSLLIRSLQAIPEGTTMTPTPAAPSGELPDDYERWDGLREAVSDFRNATYEFARGQRPEDNDTMMAAQRRIFAEARAAVSQAAPEQAVETLKAFWTGVYWKGVSRDECDDIDSAFRALAAPSGAPKQPPIPLYSEYTPHSAWAASTVQSAPKVSACGFNEFSSRVCEKGTRGCHIYHGPHAVQSAPAKDDADPIGDFQAEDRQAKLDDFVASMQSAPVLPENDEVYDEVCRERGKLNRSTYVSSNAVNDVLAAVRRLAAAQSTPVQVEGQQEQTLQPSCDSALRAEPGSQHEAMPAVLFDGKAVYDEVQRVAPCKTRTSPENVAEALDAVVRLLKAEHAQPHSAGSARQGGEHAPEIVQALALPVAAAPEQKP